MSGEDNGDASDELDILLAGGAGLLFMEDRYEVGLKERPKLAILSSMSPSHSPLNPLFWLTFQSGRQAQ